MPPAISVIIPAYNYARYLPFAVRSVLAQDWRDFEVLIIDDGSTDDTAAVAAELVRADPRVRYLHKRNAGLSAARNTGIEHAQAPLLAFLDADDEWEPTFLSRCHAQLEALGPDFGLVASLNSRIDARGQPIPTKAPRGLANRAREVSRDDILLRTHFSPSAVLVRREAFARAGGFDTSLRSTEDRDMWIRIGAVTRMYLLPVPLIRVRRHGANMSLHADRMRAAMHSVLWRAWRQDPQPWRAPWRWLRVAAYYHVQNAWMRHEAGRTGQAALDLLRSWLLWPVFLNPARLDEPALFRLRSLGRFLLRPERPPGKPA